MMLDTYSLPSWLQKELDVFGVLSGSTGVVGSKPTLLDELESLADYRPCNEPVGWKPSYLGEEPPF